MLFGGSPSPRVPRPVPFLLPLPSPPAWEAAAGALGERSGRAGRAGEDSGRAPEAPRPPRPAPSPVPAPGGRSARSPPAGAPPLSLLACPALRCRSAAHPSAGQPGGPRRPSRAGTAAGRGRVLASTMRAELWLLVLVLREAARALSPQPGAGRTGQSWWGWVRSWVEGAGGRAWAWKVPAGWRCQRRRGSCPREARSAVDGGR